MSKEAKTPWFGWLLVPVTLSLLLVAITTKDSGTWNIAIFLIWFDIVLSLIVLIYTAYVRGYWRKNPESKEGKAYAEMVSKVQAYNQQRGLKSYKQKIRPVLRWFTFLLLVTIGHFVTAIFYVVFTIGANFATSEALKKLPED